MAALHHNTSRWITVIAVLLTTITLITCDNLPPVLPAQQPRSLNSIENDITNEDNLDIGGSDDIDPNIFTSFYDPGTDTFLPKSPTTPSLNSESIPTLSPTSVPTVSGNNSPVTNLQTGSITIPVISSNPINSTPTLPSVSPIISALPFIPAQLPQGSSTLTPSSSVLSPSTPSSIPSSSLNLPLPPALSLPAINSALSNSQTPSMPLPPSTPALAPSSSLPLAPSSSLPLAPSSSLPRAPSSSLPPAPSSLPAPSPSLTPAPSPSLTPAPSPSQSSFPLVSPLPLPSTQPSSTSTPLPLPSPMSTPTSIPSVQPTSQPILTPISSSTSTPTQIPSSASTPSQSPKPSGQPQLPAVPPSTPTPAQPQPTPASSLQPQPSSSSSSATVPSKLVSQLFSPKVIIPLPVQSSDSESGKFSISSFGSALLIPRKNNSDSQHSKITDVSVFVPGPHPTYVDLSSDRAKISIGGLESIKGELSRQISTTGASRSSMVSFGDIKPVDPMKMNQEQIKNQTAKDQLLPPGTPSPTIPISSGLPTINKSSGIVMPLPTPPVSPVAKNIELKPKTVPPELEEEDPTYKDVQGSRKKNDYTVVDESSESIVKDDKKINNNIIPQGDDKSKVNSDSSKSATSPKIVVKLPTKIYFLTPPPSQAVKKPAKAMSPSKKPLFGARSVFGAKTINSKAGKEQTLKVSQSGKKPTEPKKATEAIFYATPFGSNPFFVALTGQPVRDKGQAQLQFLRPNMAQLTACSNYYFYVRWTRDGQIRLRLTGQNDGTSGTCANVPDTKYIEALYMARRWKQTGKAVKLMSKGTVGVTLTSVEQLASK